MTTKIRTPEEIIAELAPAYTEWKSGEKGKEKFKKEFFTAVTEYLKEEGNQAEELVSLEAPDEETALRYVEQRYPAWLVDDIRDHPTESGSYEVIIVENPEYQPFTIEFDGKVWGRQVAAGATMLDNERLEEENPELWKSVTTYPWLELMEAIAYEAGKDGEDVEEYVERQCERHGLKRQLLPLGDLPDEVMAELKDYFYEDKPQVKLPAPKKAESAEK